MGGEDGFNGTFDGNNHTITFKDSLVDVITVTPRYSSTSYYAGVFGHNLGTIKNLTVDGTGELHSEDITSSSVPNIYMGAVAGENEETGVIEKCVSNLSVSIKRNAYKPRWYGGITGYTYGTITGCVNNGSVSFAYPADTQKSFPDFVGGIVGQVNGADIKDCVNNGKITREPCESTQTGGIVGSISGECKLENCINNGEVLCTSSQYGSRSYAGGIAGHISKDAQCKITGCENTGDVSIVNDATSDNCIGGIVGWAESSTTVTDCANSGNMSGRGYMGGVLGQGVGCAIDHCTNSGDLSCDSNYGSGTATGGIAGRLTGEEGNRSTVTGCVNTGKVDTARGNKGYISGSSTSGPEDYQDNVFVQYDKNINGNGSGDGLNNADADNMEPLDPDILGDDIDEAVEEAARTDITVSLKTTDPNKETGEKILLTADGKPTAKAYIVLSANKETSEIYRYMSSEFTFNTDKDCDYVITPYDNTVITDLGEVEAAEGMKSHKYGFNLDGVPASISGKNIVIAEIELVSYGKHSINVVNGVVQTAKNSVFHPDVDDNIVYTYKYDSSASKDGKLHIGGIDGDPAGEDGTWEMEKTIPNKNVTINVMFPNKLDDSVANDYIDDMTVTVEGGAAFKSVIPLGDYGDKPEEDSDETWPTDDAIGVTSINKAKFDYTKPETVDTGENANGYQINMAVPVPEDTGTRYTFTFRGAGYRTYSVDAVIAASETEPHVINVWNNAMDSDVTVTASDGFKNVDERVTFLAGDIDDSKHIDLYDLSAAVAYFGKAGADMSGYVKYDLNRDSAIDSKDIAMVLVSWGK